MHELEEDIIRFVFLVFDVLRRKRIYKKIENIDDNIIIIEITDKLQNLISDYGQYKIRGKEFLVTEAINYDENGIIQ